MRETVREEEGFMIPLIAITIFFAVFMVLIGLVGRRADRQREETPPAQTPPAHH